VAVIDLAPSKYVSQSVLGNSHGGQVARDGGLGHIEALFLQGGN
jgi:hypothetical protein